MVGVSLWLSDRQDIKAAMHTAPYGWRSAISKSMYQQKHPHHIRVERKAKATAGLTTKDEIPWNAILVIAENSLI